MNKIMYGLMICALANKGFAATADPLVFTITAQQHEKSKLLLVLVGNTSAQLTDIAAVIKKDLEFSGQFAVTVETRAQEPQAKSELTALADAGYPLAVFIRDVNHEHALAWRVYETSCAQMIKGKKYEKRGAVARGWAHNVADSVWQELTGQEGFFSTKIAYAQEVPGKKGRKLKHIYVADYDGSHAQALVTTPTINVAPRFNRDANRPLLFYSESTNANIRLKVVSMDRRSKTASNFDGVNMLPAFSADGTKLVYCASHGHGNCQLYYYDKGTMKVLTNNKGNNISPSLSDDATRLYFCSDCDSGRPQIYYHSLITGIQTAITPGAQHCYSPSYCSKNHKLAYAKMVKGVMQLFVFDEATGVHTQLTFDNDNKDECSWSSCGNYLLFCSEKGNQGRIAMLNVHTNERRYLTAANAVCSYPTWSPVYAEYPVVA
jgi:TolB protein